MKTNFQLIHDFIESSNATNSNTAKLDVLKISTQYEIVRNALKYTYDPYKQYFVTSKNCKKRSDLTGPVGAYEDLFVLLDDLIARVLTGHDAIAAVNQYVIENKDFEDIIFNIIDGNLKTRSTASMINKVVPKLIPTFDVALAVAYDEKTKKKVNYDDGWYVSRKLDGCLSEDTLIEFEDGQFIKIKEVVDNRIAGNIKSYNTLTSEIEFKPIADWMVNLDDINKDNTEWFELTLENDQTIKLTGNHRIWLPELKCWRRTDELDGDEMILYTI
jgi:hypothetical protein